VSTNDLTKMAWKAIPGGTERPLSPILVLMLSKKFSTWRKNQAQHKALHWPRRIHYYCAKVTSTKIKT